MCGICGYISLNETSDGRGLLEAMARTLVHRGPDDEGYFLDKGVGLGIRRLSIIDVQGGHQPIPNEDRTVWLVFNGEIYNYIELRRILVEKGHRFLTQTDTEVIVHLYEESGVDFVRQLNGMFAFAIWDSKNKRFILGRDRLGIKPLYYTETDSGLIFASEPRALLAHPQVNIGLDLEALKKYLVLEYIPAPFSIFHGIKKLLPGHLLVYEGGHAALLKYWGLSYVKRSRLTLGEARSELMRLLRSSVMLRLRSDVPLGIFLSGGIDSSTVTAIMADLAPGRVKSFSIGFEDPSFDESFWAESASRYIGTDHHRDMLSPARLLELIPAIGNILDEPLGDASIVPTYLLSRFAREQVTVALGGDGGDELFAGYPTYQAHRLAMLFEKFPTFLLKAMRIGAGLIPASFADWSLDFRAKRFLAGLGWDPPLRHHIWVGSFDPDEVSKILLHNSPGDSLDELRRYWQECDSEDLVEKAQYLDLKLYMQDDILMKVDRASMACSLEVRSPYLDFRVVEFLASLPSWMKLRFMKRKYLLSEIAKDLIPSDITARKKKGFGIPVARWINNELRGLVDEYLNRERIEREGLFNWDVVNGFLKEHRAGIRDNRKKLWTLLIFELWRQTWL